MRDTQPRPAAAAPRPETTGDAQRPVLRAPLHGRYSILLVLGGVFLALSSALRLALALGWRQELDLSPLTVSRIALTGLVYDLAAFGWVAAPAALYLALAPARLLRSRPHRLIAWSVCALGVGLLVFDLAAEWFFWDEFTARFNFIAVDYLVYTKEVVGNVVESYPLPAVLTGVLAVSLVLLLALRGPMGAALSFSRLERGRVLPLMGFLLLPAGSWFLPPDLDEVSDNRFDNELAKNGLYSLFSAFRQNVLDYEAFYLTMPDEQREERLRALLRHPGTRFEEPAGGSVVRRFDSPGEPRRLNVVCITVESLSAEYMGVFGREETLTPRLDALAEESLLFTKLFATGSRTVRGLEALTLSVPPTPGRSIVKRPNCSGLHSLGRVLGEQGYEARFMYGGYGYFDNMNAFFAGNGYEVVDRTDIPDEDVRFANIWGVCDQDLFERVLEECDATHAAGKPLFAEVMTTSNHRPYTYPQVIDVPSGTGRAGAVKYCDFAIGEFLERARGHEWFEDTIFVIVADHCAGSAGKRELDLSRHLIPMLIWAPGIVEPGRVDVLASQLDVAPTILGLLGLDYRARFFGSDLLNGGGGRAFVANYQSLGLYDGEHLAVLRPQREVEVFAVRDDLELVECGPQPELVYDAVAFYQGAARAYREGGLLYDGPAANAHP